MNDFQTVKNKRAPLRPGYLCVTIALTLAVCALGCMSVISSCEPNARYFTSSPLSTAFCVALALSAVSSVGALFIFKKERINITESNEGYAKAAKYLNLLPAALSLCVTIFFLSSKVLGEWGNAVIISSAVASLYFILKLFPRFIVMTVIFGVGVFALGAVVIASLYLDLAIELNSHFKLLVQFGAAGIILGTIADLRLILSPEAPKGFKLPDREFVRIGARGYIALKSLSLTLTATCASVVILYFIKGNSALGPHYLLYSVLYLAYAISAVSELIGAVISVIKGHI